MSVTTDLAPRPLRVCVRSGSRAELVTRRMAARQKVAAKAPVAETAALAGGSKVGFKPHPTLDLHDRGGKIITDLVYTNFYVGGPAAWQKTDMQNIDTKLAAAMSDANLNNVLLQYFRGAKRMTSVFRPSVVLAGPAPQAVSQADVEKMVRDLFVGGRLAGFDVGNTVFNFMLPRGTVLTIDDGSGDRGPVRGAAHDRARDQDGDRGGEIEKESSSLEGLGGFHGSVHSGASTLYYAVGVYSEGNNGIVAFDQPWKNVVATFYHELIEARTDAGVEDNAVAWVNNENPSEEIGDIPMTLAGANLSKVMKEVPLADGSGTVPIQLMWSNAVHAPEGPIVKPHPTTH